jgi:hypothetical protein
MRGKILRIRYGLNPNSSSIGANLGLFLAGATVLTIMVNLLDASIRLWLGRCRKKEQKT